MKRLTLYVDKSGYELFKSGERFWVSDERGDDPYVFTVDESDVTAVGWGFYIVNDSKSIEWLSG